MVHARYNEKELNPNPSINFISCLSDEPTRQEEARQVLRALAAQVKPVMKQHGFEVNSLEEYEYNAVFAGRNWNSGETIELVLRKPDGLFYPIYWLMSTLCHELAHIKHMNHGPAFQALWSRLRTEVHQLQARGYYGDGFWSSGTRLRDLAQIGGDGVECHDLPEYVCGGAQTRSRPTANRRRRHSGPRGKKREVVPSLHTGAQTAKKRKAGSRMSSKYAFTGEGIALSKSDDGGMGFGKRAFSKRAREERALAAERRLLALQGKSQVEDEGSTTDSDEEIEIIAETDTGRRQALLDSEHSTGDLRKLTAKDWELFRDEFKSESSTSRSTNMADSSSVTTWSLDPVDDDVIEIFSSDTEKGDGRDARCDVPQSSGSVFTTGNVHPSRSSKGKGKEQAEAVSFAPSTSRTQNSLGPRKLVQTEIDFKNKEPMTVLVHDSRRSVEKTPSMKRSPSNGTATDKLAKVLMWNCLVCTFANERGHLVCAACSTPKGQQTWTGILES